VTPIFIPIHTGGASVPATPQAALFMGVMMALFTVPMVGMAWQATSDRYYRDWIICWMLWTLSGFCAVLAYAGIAAGLGAK
jgi:hypothetical protein